MIHGCVINSTISPTRRYINRLRSIHGVIKFHGNLVIIYSQYEFSKYLRDTFINSIRVFS